MSFPSGCGGRYKGLAVEEQAINPPPDCAACPRLAAMRADNARALPGGWNAPVPSFGALGAPLLIVGLAPGLKGANFTGRPFTGDGAGQALYPALAEAGLARGAYAARADDGLELIGCRITNAVRCVPPGNAPTTQEVRTCGGFLRAEIAAMPALRAVLALGGVAHRAVLAALGLKASAHPFAHGAEAHIRLPPPNPPFSEGGEIMLVSSYHPSRYNLNTGRVTPEMIAEILRRARMRADEQ
jgi:uracil-DNA glycosylase